MAAMAGSRAAAEAAGSDDERKFALATTFHFILLTGMLKAKKTECRVGGEGAT